MTSIKNKMFLSFNSSFYLKKMGLVLSRLFVSTEKEDETKEYDVEIAAEEFEETENFVQNILESKYLLKSLEFFRNSFFHRQNMRFPKTVESYSNLLQRCREKRFREWLFRSNEMTKGRRAALLCSLLEGIFLFDDSELLQILSAKKMLLGIHSSANGKIRFEFRNTKRHSFFVEVSFAKVCVETNCASVHKLLTTKYGLWVYLPDNSEEFLQRYGEFLMTTL
ncbi:hypothetical protein PMV_028 [Port-miou virus]|uniref:Uncharacterized protein n=1 Tax=Port-miou virus TaxID=1733873 RepID=A0A0N9P6F0_9VIRU|nr:hypothetical protein PMV_028 [Port-miou virus]